MLHKIRELCGFLLKNYRSMIMVTLIPIEEKKMELNVLFTPENMHVKYAK
jgi:hypothetical protein